MSGVLQRLAARVLPAPGTVRPRLGSRFDGLSGPGPADTEAGRGPTTAETRPGPAAPTPGEPSAAPAPRSAAPGASRPGVRSERQIAEQHHPRAAHAQLVEPAAPPLPHPTARRRDGVAPAGAPALDAPSGLPASAAAAAASRSVPVPPAGPASADMASAAEPPTRRSPEALPRTPSQAAPAAAEADSPAAAAWREAPLLSPRPPGEAASHPSHDPPARTAAAPATAAPDIQVSIGRIEIRADRNEPRPARRPPPRPALMSLEDYLGKGRGRR